MYVAVFEPSGAAPAFNVIPSDPGTPSWNVKWFVLPIFVEYGTSFVDPFSIRMP
jgi:hypothetical protein